MSYNGAALMATAVGQREMELLKQGLSYQAIATLTGTRVGSLKERNRLAYRIDIYRAFRERIERDGIPNQLRVGDDFGHYFAGLFDGEGHLIAWHRVRTRGKAYPEFRLGMQIVLRDDDADVLEYVREHLGGRIHPSLHKSQNANPAANWRLENVKDLAEKIVPLFDKYSLRTKKRREYEVWRPLVIERYLATLGGETARGGPTLFEPDFLTGVKAVQLIRQYPTRRLVPEVAG
jgi:hypothetical protein